MDIRQTHTYAKLAVRPSTVKEIKALLEKAGYEHAIHEDDDDDVVIDMNGIALVSNRKKRHGTRK